MEHNEDILAEILKELRETKAMVAQLLSRDIQAADVCRLDGGDTADRPALSLQRAFTLNDKFRFRRELFGGSEQAMADVLARLETAGSVEDVADYLCGELGWDRTNEAVSDFISIISNCRK